MANVKPDVETGDAPLNDPKALAELQNKVLEMMQAVNPYDHLPKVVKKRVKALKKLQVERLKMEVKFHEEMHALECKYAQMYQPIYDKRMKIVAGEYEPNDDECDFPSDTEEEDEDKLSEDVKDKVNIKKGDKGDEAMDTDGQDTKGIPSFWLQVFRNCDIVGENLQEHDEPILSHLQDIKVIHRENPMGFTIEFYFSENEYFTDRVLTKSYEMKCALDPEDPLSFEGAEIYKCAGCTINWKPGKNVTVKTVQKKQKNKNNPKQVRTVQKEKPQDSFFNFFNPPTVSENPDEVDENDQALLQADFEMGEVIRTQLVPRAVLYFTGELYDDEDEDDEDEELDDDDLDDEDLEDE